MTSSNFTAERVKETSTSTGTGDFTLAGAVSEFISINAAFGTTSGFQYLIKHDTLDEWEAGVAIITDATTMKRGEIFDNSLGTNAKINFSAGDKTIICTPLSALTSPVILHRNSSNVLSAHLIPNTTDTLVLTALRCYFIPFYVPYFVKSALTFRFNVTTAGAASTVARAGLYKLGAQTTSTSGVSDSNMGIASLLFEGSASVAVDSTGSKAITISGTNPVKPGWYYLGFISDGTPTVRAHTEADVIGSPPMLANGLTSGGIYTHASSTEVDVLAMPTNFNGGSLRTGNVPAVFMRSTT